MVDPDYIFRKLAQLVGEVEDETGRAIASMQAKFSSGGRGFGNHLLGIETVKILKEGCQKSAEQIGRFLIAVNVSKDEAALEEMRVAVDAMADRLMKAHRFTLFSHIKREDEDGRSGAKQALRNEIAELLDLCATDIWYGFAASAKGAAQANQVLSVTGNHVNVVAGSPNAVVQQGRDNLTLNQQQGWDPAPLLAVVVQAMTLVGQMQVAEDQSQIARAELATLEAYAKATKPDVGMIRSLGQRIGGMLMRWGEAAGTAAATEIGRRLLDALPLD